MKRLRAFIVICIMVLPVYAQPVKRITILHTNDLHSRLMGYAPESAYSPLTVNDDKTVGGFARIAALIKSEKAANSGNIIVADAGDFTMGTLFPSIEEKYGFQLRLMCDMGYDVVGIGNHEYEFGTEWLGSVIGMSAQNGKVPGILIGNAIFSEKDKRDDILEKEFSEGIIRKKLILERNGLRIGLFSILGKNAVSVAPKSEPVTFAKQTTFAKKMVKELQAEKCNIIICISHSGLTKEKDGTWGGEDVDLAKEVKGIDVIIGGHTHTRLDEPILVNGTAIVQTGEFGQFVGSLSLDYAEGKVKVVDYKLIPVDDSVAGDPVINELIEKEKARIDSLILKPLGLDYSKPLAKADFRLEGNDVGDYVNSNIGPFIADAIQYYVNRNTRGGSDFSMVAAGMIFDKIVPGILTVPDIFRVMPLGSGEDKIPGYPLSRIYITGKELKSVLEILQVASKSDPQNYCYYSGLRVGYNPGKGLFRKIRSVGIVHNDGTVSQVDFSKKNKTLYSVTADSYMLGFIGIIKKTSFGLINVVPKDAAGNKIKDMNDAVIDMDESSKGIQEGKEWLALVQYLGSMRDTDGDGIPEIDTKYKLPVKSFVLTDK